MPLALLCLGLTLVGALQTQAQYLAPSLVPAPPLSKIPMEENFKDDKFQGKWYVVALAGNDVWKKEHGDFKMYSTNYKLESHYTYNVTTNLLSDDGCEQWIGTLVPSVRPGRFHLGNLQNFRNLRRYTMQVIATDYSDFAYVFSKKNLDNTEYFKIRLYGRKKDVQGPLLKAVFIVYARSLGLTDDNIIFPVPIVCCIDD